MNVKSNYRHIIWDWNGTLLDDVDIVIDAMNKLLKRRNLPLLDLERYRNIFTFPVREYYAGLGFNFITDPFEKLASEFTQEYSSQNNKFKLFNEVEEVLNFIGKMGINQSILSASQEEGLIQDVARLNISNYFISIAGLNNHYAISKVARGKDLLQELGLKPEEVLLIGDTIHDYKVSKELGCDCLLISNGHQSHQRIADCNTAIASNISEVINYLKQEAIA